jgi:hypothetical protein
MNFPSENNDKINNLFNEDRPVYASREDLEEARLIEAINRTPTNKFRFLMTLMKMNNSMRKAVIHYKK